MIFCVYFFLNVHHHRFCSLRIGEADPCHFDTDPDPGKNYTDPDRGKKGFSTGTKQILKVW